MKSSACACLCLLILALTSTASANPEPEPTGPIPTLPERTLDAYNDAMSDLELAVDGYFHAAIRTRISATDERLHELDAALEEQARAAAESAQPSLLTIRELVVHSKLVVLSELDERFADGKIPADVDEKLASLHAERSASIDLLVEGGEL